MRLVAPDPICWHSARVPPGALPHPPRPAVAAGKLTTEIKTLREQMETGRLNDLRKLNAKIAEKDEMIQQLRDEQQRTATQRKEALLKAERQRQQHAKTTKHLQVAKERNAELQAQLDKALKAQQDFDKRLAEVTAKAKKDLMQQTLQSMVRLCIVAPSVSLHINSKEKALKGPFPEERIRRIIEEEILPRYTELYIQFQEGSAPDGSKLEDWLETMLSAMYQSMKEHLQEIFRNNIIKKADFEW